MNWFILFNLLRTLFTQPALIKGLVNSSVFFSIIVIFGFDLVFHTMSFFEKFSIWIKRDLFDQFLKA